MRKFKLYLYKYYLKLYENVRENFAFLNHCIPPNHPVILQF